MGDRAEEFGPVLDFTDDPESAVLTGQPVKAVTDDFTVEGDAQIKLDLAPVSGVYLHAVFNEPRLLAAMMNAMSEQSRSLCLMGATRG